MSAKFSHIYEHAEFVIYLTIAEKKNLEKRNRKRRYESFLTVL